MRVVADSHAIVWYIAGSRRLSPAAATALQEAEATGGIVVSVASLIDLWYVTQTTEAITAEALRALRTALDASPRVTLREVGLVVVDAAATIPRDLLADPWDRLIVATASAEGVPLVTRDRAIRASALVECLW